MSSLPHEPDPSARLMLSPTNVVARMTPALIAGGLVLLGAAGLLGRADPARAARAWLVAFLFVLSIALGALFFVLVQFASRAGWSVTVRRVAENVMALMPLLALLFIPVALSMPHLFEWTHAGRVASDPLLQHKRPYLNTGFFLARAAVCFLAWSAIALWYRARSIRQDQSADPNITRRLQAASGPAIAAFAITTSVAAIDWVMSLQPHWFSSMIGVYFFSGAVLAAFSVLALIVQALRTSGALGHLVTAEHMHDLGKLLFAFVAFWTYIAFSQYFLIWYATLPEETPFYLARWSHGWKPASVALAVGHFAVPFFFLMSRAAKRRPPLLVGGSLWVLAMHYLDLYWLVMPAFLGPARSGFLLDAAFLIGMSSLGLGVIGWLTRRAALIPARDPRLNESLSFENG